jgi:hypothetical protein
MPSPDVTIARMTQPASPRSDAFQPWSRGRGVDVWAMLCAAITGDLATIRRLVARDPNLIDCEYEYLKPLHFAVREDQREGVAFLLESGANPALEFGESLLTLARDRGHEELARLLESTLEERFEVLIGYLQARGADYDISTAATIGDLDRVAACSTRIPRSSTGSPRTPLTIPDYRFAAPRAPVIWKW